MAYTERRWTGVRLELGASDEIVGKLSGANLKLHRWKIRAIQQIKPRVKLSINF